MHEAGRENKDEDEGKMSETIGIDVTAPKKKCNDIRCPFHGSLKCRGRIFEGVVISAKMTKTVNVEWSRKHYIPKYEGYEKRRTHLKAHNPECIDAREGDMVRISECRPLSKTKHFVVIEKLGKERGFEEKIEAREEAKAKAIRKEKKEEMPAKDEKNESA